MTPRAPRVRGGRAPGPRGGKRLQQKPNLGVSKRDQGPQGTDREERVDDEDAQRRDGRAKDRIEIIK